MRSLYQVLTVVIFISYSSPRLYAQEPLTQLIEQVRPSVLTVATERGVGSGEVCVVANWHVLFGKGNLMVSVSGTAYSTN